MSNDLALNLNETITAAVKSRVEAEMLNALSGDAVIGKFVIQALQQEVTVKDGYRDKKVPFLTHVLEQTIQQAAKAAVVKLIAAETESIEEAVRNALRRDLAGIASTLTKSLVDAADRAYGFNVALSLRMPN